MNFVSDTPEYTAALARASNWLQPGIKVRPLPPYVPRPAVVDHMRAFGYPFNWDSTYIVEEVGHPNRRDGETGKIAAPKQIMFRPYRLRCWFSPVHVSSESSHNPTIAGLPFLVPLWEPVE